MKTGGRPLKAVLAIKAVLVAGLALGATALTAAPASAHGHVSVGIGIGFPVYGPGWGYYGPYRPYYRPYYAPPVVYAPPPVVYAAPPVVYAPQPAYYQEPVQAVPTSPVYRASTGQYCREYQSTVRVDGHYENSYGTACQQPDGSWRIAN